MANYKIELCYDGSKYRGWQHQDNTQNTIQDKLTSVLSKIIGEPVELIASGRTDAGVHANKQVVNFHCQKAIDTDKTIYTLRHQLPRDIGIYSLTEVNDDFHARYSCLKKTYRYYIWNSNDPCVFIRNYREIICEPLDIESMTQSCKLLIGTHDFSAFTTNKSKNHNNIRQLYNAAVTREGQNVILEFTADGFLYNMVRILSGTIIEIGQNKRSISSITKAFETKKRSESGYTAPANALFLWNVEY